MEFIAGGIIFLFFMYVAFYTSEKLERHDDEYWRNKGGR